MSKQNEYQQDRRCLVELLSSVDEGRADAEQIASAHTQHDEDRHVGDAVAKRANGRDDKGPDRIKDRCTGEDEQDEIETKPERRLDPDEVHPHWGKCEDRQAETERDPETVAHVPRHRLQVHPGAMAHLVRHGVDAGLGVRRMIGHRDGRCAGD